MKKENIFASKEENPVIEKYEVLHVKVDKKNTYGVKVSYSQSDTTFLLEVVLTERAKLKRVKKDIRKALGNPKVMKKYNELLKNEKISEDDPPNFEVRIIGGKEKARESIRKYISKLLSQPPKKLLNKPKDWKKQLILTITMPFLIACGIYAGYKFAEYTLRPTIENLQQQNEALQSQNEALQTQVNNLQNKLSNYINTLTQHVPGIREAINAISTATDQALQYIQDILNPETGIIAQIRNTLENARNYLDDTTVKLFGIKQSALSIKEIASQGIAAAQEQLQKIAERLPVISDQLERLKEGWDYTWDDGSTTRISADYDGDGQVDAWQDENGVWHYDEDSENPAIPYHKAVQEGVATDPDFFNIANAFEQACKDYLALQQEYEFLLLQKEAWEAELSRWQTVYNLAEGIESDASAAVTYVTSAQGEINKVIGSEDVANPLLQQLEDKLREIEQKLNEIKTNVNTASQELSYVENLVSEEGMKVSVSSFSNSREVGVLSKACCWLRNKWVGFFSKHPRMAVMVRMGVIMIGIGVISFVIPPVYYIWWGYRIKCAINLRKPWKEFHKLYDPLLKYNGPTGVLIN